MTVRDTPSPVMLTLVDRALDQSFRSQGYATFPLLDAVELATLLDAWETGAVSMNGWPYAASLYSPDQTFRQAMHKAVAAVIEAPLRRIVPEAALIFAGFACKAASEPASLVPFHQDPSFVDEARWGAANVWIPLVDLDDSNGPLWVVPGSHRFNIGCRGFNQTFAYTEFEPALTELAHPLHARAGEAIIFAHTLFHFSPPNRSANPRLAAGGLLAERGAPLRYPFVDPDAREWIEMYEADPALFLEAPISTRPNRPSAGRHPAEHQPLDMDMVRAAAGPG